jgi:hypothetical protein
MLRKKAAAQFTPPTLEEMSKFILRSWRALRPKQGTERREVYYDLGLSENVIIRIWTSIGAGQETAAGVGSDAIRIQILAKKGGRSWPLLKGKSPIVKRTQGWKNNLQDRVEDYLELYEEKEAVFEAQATGVPVRTPAPDQDKGDPEEEEREQEEREEAQQQPTPEPERNDRPEANATFTKLKSGDWGLRIQGDVKSGDRVLAKRQSGQAQVLTVGEIVWRGQDHGSFITVSTIGRARTASETCGCGGTGVRADGQPCCGGCQKAASGDYQSLFAESDYDRTV